VIEKGKRRSGNKYKEMNKKTIENEREESELIETFQIVPRRIEKANGKVNIEKLLGRVQYTAPRKAAQ